MCKFSIQYLGVQVLECTAEPLISFAIFYCGLSELWERACNLDKHLSMLLELNQEKKPTKPLSNQENTS